MRSRLRLPRRLVGGAVLVLSCLGLAACGGPDVTAARLENAIGPAFAQLYEQQQALLGSHDTGAQAGATCRRNDTSVASSGAGDDWVCQLLLAGSGPTQALTYEVNAKADGCYTADGPPGLVGGRTLRAKDGSSRVNPLFAFDGCFDIS